MKAATKYASLLVLAAGAIIVTMASVTQGQVRPQIKPVILNTPVNLISIPNVPLRITGVEVQAQGDGSFALNYSLVNGSSMTAEASTLSLIIYGADGAPKGGENWSLHESVPGGTTAAFHTALKSSLESGDRVSISFISARIGHELLESNVAGIVRAAAAGLTESEEPAKPTWSMPDAGDRAVSSSARCASTTAALNTPQPEADATPTQTPATTPAPTPAPSPTPACDPVSFCQACTNSAVTVCGLGRVASVTCNGAGCTCAYTCKLANQ